MIVVKLNLMCPKNTNAKELNSRSHLLLGLAEFSIIRAVLVHKWAQLNSPVYFHIMENGAVGYCKHVSQCLTTPYLCFCLSASTFETLTKALNDANMDGEM